MPNKLLLQNDPVFREAETIQTIVKPLREHFNISYFQYDRCYADNSRIVLTSRGDWLKHCLDNEYYKISYFESGLSSQSSKNILWGNVNEVSAPVFYAAREFFDIDNGFTIINAGKNYTEYFHFAGGKDDSSILPIYMEKIGLIHKFIFYFKEKVQSIIKNMDRHRIIYPARNVYDCTTVDRGSRDSSGVLLDESGKYYLFGEDRPYLTKSQVNLLTVFLKSDSIAAVAVQLGISERTAYAHVCNIKNKLGCRTLFQLGQLLARSRFHQ